MATLPPYSAPMATINCTFATVVPLQVVTGTVKFSPFPLVPSHPSTVTATLVESGFTITLEPSTESWIWRVDANVHAGDQTFRFDPFYVALAEGEVLDLSEAVRLPRPTP